MMEYAFYVTTSKSGVEGQGNTHTYVGTDIQTNMMVHKYRPIGIETTGPIGLGFSWRIIQSDL